jgi:hypothetical protein
MGEAQSLGVRLLADLRTVFGDEAALSTAHILEQLHKIEESPWADIKGKALDSRGLSYRLGKYHITPKQVRVSSWTGKGYTREDFHDAWHRYLRPSAPLSGFPQGGETGETSGTRDYASDPLADDEFPPVAR